MEKILDIITAKMQQAFADAGYDAFFGRVTVSNRPDLCEYQCNGALSAAKQYKCAPIKIAQAVVEKLNAEDNSEVTFDQVLAVGEAGSVKVGAPVVEGASVVAKVVKTGKGKKLNILTYRPKKGSMVRKGHRQPYTKVEITAING